MAGTNPGFPSDAIRQAIRFVYDMAAAPVDDQQATFYGVSTLVYTGTFADDEEVPFDPATTVVNTPPPG